MLKVVSIDLPRKPDLHDIQLDFLLQMERLRHVIPAGSFFLSQQSDGSLE